eukprot:gene40657-40368_t
MAQPSDVGAAGGSPAVQPPPQHPSTNAPSDPPEEQRGPLMVHGLWSAYAWPERHQCSPQRRATASRWGVLLDPLLRCADCAPPLGDRTAAALWGKEEVRWLRRLIREPFADLANYMRQLADSSGYGGDPSGLLLPEEQVWDVCSQFGLPVPDAFRKLLYFRYSGDAGQPRFRLMRFEGLLATLECAVGPVDVWLHRQRLGALTHRAARAFLRRLDAAPFPHQGAEPPRPPSPPNTGPPAGSAAERLLRPASPDSWGSKADVILNARLFPGSAAGRALRWLLRPMRSLSAALSAADPGRTGHVFVEQFARAAAAAGGAECQEFSRNSSTHGRRPRSNGTQRRTHRAGGSAAACRYTMPTSPGWMSGGSPPYTSDRYALHAVQRESFRPTPPGA